MPIETSMLLYRAAIQIPYLHLEDVFLAGFCAEHVDIRRYNNPFIRTYLYENICHMRGLVYSHDVDVTLMRETYEKISNSSIECY